MPNISEFTLTLSDVDFHELYGQTGDLMIVETGLASDWGLTLAEQELALLQEQGRTVIGYLNVCVTDHERTYWEDAWVDYTGAGGGGGTNRDVGTVLPGAQDYLENHHGYAQGGETVIGYIVDYTDAVWQDRVIAEAVQMVSPVAEGGLGYDGVFLDDVSRYYDAASNDPDYSYEQAAQDMIAFVNAISDAVRAINPDAYIAVNGGAYIGPDSRLPDGQDYADFLANIDALLMESQFGTDAWPDAMTNWRGDHDFLAVEHGNRVDDPEAFVAWALALGLIPHLAATDSYDTAAITPGGQTEGDDLLTGGDGPNLIFAEDGDDTVWSGSGSDTLHGGRGNDLLGGGDGADLLFGGSGRDTTWGGAGDDTIWAGDENDLLGGGTGADLLGGGAGQDTLWGGIGQDLLWGGGASDLLGGGAGADDLSGDAGSDTIWGNAGSDTLLGGRGNDLLGGGSDGDLLSGGAGQDTLRGGAGADTLFGDGGNDLLEGGSGADSFVFGTGFGNDIIQEFSLAQGDQLRLDRALWFGAYGELSEAEVIQQFSGIDAGGNVVLTFPDGSIVTLIGVSDTTGIGAALDIF